MERTCPFCSEILKSERSFCTHLALIHEAMEQGAVQEQSIKSLEKTKDRVEFLLRKIPATRNSDWLLYLYLLRFWGQALVYDTSTKLIQFKNPKGITYEEFVRLPSWETCRRSRQSVVAKHPELQPSEPAVLARRAKERAYRGHFKDEKLEKAYADGESGGVCKLPHVKTWGIP